MRLRRRLASAVLAASRALPRFRGKRRLARGVHAWLDPVPSPRLVRVGSTVFEVTGRDQIEFNLLSEGAGSPEIVATLQTLVRRGAGVFWDVGANIGTITLALVARCPELEVCAFEPSPPVLVLLRRNLALNDALSRSVRVLGFALGDPPRCRVVLRERGADQQRARSSRLRQRPSASSTRNREPSVRRRYAAIPDRASASAPSSRAASHSHW